METCSALNLLMDGTQKSWDFGRRGKNLVRKGILQFPDFPEWTVPAGEIWRENPFRNRSWQWRLHCLAFLPWLVADHWQRKDVASLELGLQFILDWNKAWLNAMPKADLEFAWHDHGSALRAENIMLFLAYGCKNAHAWQERNSMSIGLCMESLAVHGDFLMREEFYNRHTNHGLEQARVLLLLGAQLNRSDWKETARKRIRDEFYFSFTKEGVHKENSPGYHFFVLNTFMKIFNVFPEIFGEINTEIEQLVNKCVEYAAYSLRPDGYVPMIGDTEHIIPSLKFLPEFLNDPSEYFLYASSRGLQGKIPPERCKIFPESGYAFIRNTWNFDNGDKNLIYMALKAGSLEKFHYHQDEGNILLYAFGEDWLIDSGMYNYNNNDIIRKYMRSRIAHNVPVIKGEHYIDFSERFCKWKMIKHEYDEEYKVSIKLNIFQNLNIEREVVFNKKNKFIFVNDLITNLVNPKTGFNFYKLLPFINNFFDKKGIMFNWHFPSDKEIIIDNNTIMIKSKKNKKILSINIYSPEKYSIKLLTGRNGDKIYSYQSNKRFKYEDTQCIRIYFSSKLPLSCTTCFNFHE